MKPIFLYLLTTITFCSSSILFAETSPHSYPEEGSITENSLLHEPTSEVNEEAPFIISEQQDDKNTPTDTLIEEVLQKFPMEFVTVGDPGNQGDRSPENPQRGSVAHAYQIGKYEVTASEYCIFLNAVASKNDPHHLYKKEMSDDQKVASIFLKTSPEGDKIYFPIPGRENTPITYVSLRDAQRFCNWLENGAPTPQEDDSLIEESTERGAYSFSQEGNQEYTTRNPESHFYIPSENEWIKAAYYQGGGKKSGYWLYPAQHDTAPNNGQGDKTNQANYRTLATLWSPREKDHVLTPVDHFSSSSSAYGTCDMGGNVAEWTSNLISSTVRGGSWKSEYSIWNNNDLLRTASPKNCYPLMASNTIGFRIAAVVTPNTLSADSKKCRQKKENSLTNSVATWGVIKWFLPCQTTIFYFVEGLFSSEPIAPLSLSELFESVNLTSILTTAAFDLAGIAIMLGLLGLYYLFCMPSQKGLLNKCVDLWNVAKWCIPCQWCLLGTLRRSFSIVTLLKNLFSTKTFSLMRQTWILVDLAGIGLIYGLSHFPFTAITENTIQAFYAAWNLF